MKTEHPRVALPIRRRTALAALLACAAGAGFAQSGVDCTIEYATMRDGTRLATEVYRPAAEGRYPVVLQRTPYNRNGAATDASCANPMFIDFASNGYVALNQDVRGMYRSDGAFHPMQQEVTDGYDAIEWAGTRAWSNGKVGTMGGSYVGLTQRQPATRMPPHLAAIAPAITASDYHDHWTYVNSVFDLWFAQSWIHVTFGRETLLRELLRAGVPRDEANTQVTAWFDRGSAELLSNWVWQLPLKSFPEYRSVAPYYYTWLDHPRYDAYWRRLDVEPRYEQVQVPALNTGAWYDIFQIGTVRNFEGLRGRGGSDAARAGTKLVMTCCGHAGTSGQISWGETVNPTPVTTTMRFFDRYLKGVDNGVEQDPAVQLHVLNPPDTGTEGDAFWVYSDVWPLKNTEWRSWHLASGGAANGSQGDGRLERSAPAGRSVPDRFVYDPRDPVPTVGGNLCCEPALLPAGAHDQSQIELRGDVLVYTSAPLDEDLVAIGPVKVVLWASTSGPDTDFTAKLVDVHHDGIAHNVLDRIVRARFREGSKQPPQLVRPGRAYEYTIELGNVGSVFRKGHRIRLEVSSSNFPHYSRNLNTGRNEADSAEYEVANQTVFHDAARPSRLVLPVVSGIAVPGR